MTLRAWRSVGGLAAVLALTSLACDTQPGSQADDAGAGGSRPSGTGGATTQTGMGGRPDSSSGGSTGGTATGSGGSITGVGGAVTGSGGSSRPLGGSGGLVGNDGGTSTGAGGRLSGAGGASFGGAAGNITVWLAGDSTMANDGGNSCPIGWGTQFQPLFNNNATINNLAQAGTSINTWLYNVLATTDANGECNLTRDANGQPTVQARWQRMLDGMKAGDYLLIEFGINDGGACPRFEGDAVFKSSLGVMAKAATDRGAHPVFLTPTSSIRCQGATAVGTRGRFVTDAIDAGTQMGVPVLNIHQMTVDLFNAGNFCPLAGGATDISATTGGAAGAFFCDDHTHFDTSGAMSIAKLVATAIRNQNLPLAAFLN